MLITNSMKEIIKVVQARCGKQSGNECKRLLRKYGLPQYRKITFDKRVKEYSYMLVWEHMTAEFLFPTE